MFSGSRYVILDDNVTHLQAVSDSLRELGAHSLAIQFSPDEELNPLDFRNVRGLFLDLQLLDNTITRDFSRHYANIQSILEENISEDGGPFIVILWTSMPDRAAELESYLDANLDRKKPHAAPLMVIALNKTEFIDTTNGAKLPESLLTDAVRQKVSESAALASFMQWEFEVTQATAAITRHMTKMESGEWSAAKRQVSIAALLGRLAVEAVGAQNVNGAERFAIHTALLPLLSDELQNSAGQDNDSSFWSVALGASQQQQIGSAAAVDLNTRLHLATSSDPIDSTEWGAMTEIGRGFYWSLVGAKDRTSWLEKHSGFVNLSKSEVDAIRIFKVRIGASCDYAQQRRAPLPFVLCSAVPRKTEGRPRKLRDSIFWESPAISLEGVANTLVVHPSMVFTEGPDVARSSRGAYRLREQVLTELLSRLSAYSSRPGIMRFDA